MGVKKRNIQILHFPFPPPPHHNSSENKRKRKLPPKISSRGKSTNENSFQQTAKEEGREKGIKMGFPRSPKADGGGGGTMIHTVHSSMASFFQPRRLLHLQHPRVRVGRCGNSRRERRFGEVLGSRKESLRGVSGLRGGGGRSRTCREL